MKNCMKTVLACSVAVLVGSGCASKTEKQSAAQVLAMEALGGPKAKTDLKNKNVADTYITSRETFNAAVAAEFQVELIKAMSLKKGEIKESLKNEYALYLGRADAKAKLKAGYRATKLTGRRELFNGKDLTGWHADVPQMDRNTKLPQDKQVKNPFLVRNGLLVSMGTPFGHLLSDEVFENYRMEMTYRFAGKPGNCGFIVGASMPRVMLGLFPSSVEVQMNHEHAGDFWCIDENINVPNMVKRRGARDRWGVVIGQNRRIANLTDGSEKSVGEWNTMVVESLGGEIKAWVNGDLVNYGYGMTAAKGHIGVQAEGAEVEFKNITLSPIEDLTK